MLFPKVKFHKDGKIYHFRNSTNFPCHGAGDMAPLFVWVLLIWTRASKLWINSVFISMYQSKDLHCFVGSSVGQSVGSFVGLSIPSTHPSTHPSILYSLYLPIVVKLTVGLVLLVQPLCLIRINLISYSVLGCKFFRIVSLTSPVKIVKLWGSKSSSKRKEEKK